MVNFSIEENFLLKTSRLVISKCQWNRLNSTYLNALNDPEVMQFTEARHQKWDEEKMIKFIDEANQNGSILFEVKIIDDNKSIGNVRLFNWNKIHCRAELSFLFYDKSEWGKNYATEAIDLILKFGKEEFNLHRITADYYACNKASEKLFSKLGFQIEGVFRDHFWLNDNFIDSIRVGKIYS